MNKKMNSKGFTLVELMIVVLIVGVLATIAFPSYQRYVLRSHRVEARNMLQAIATRIDQNYKITRDWSRLSQKDGAGNFLQLNNDTLVAWGMNAAPAGGTARYNISFVDGTPTANGYTLRASATAIQAGDDCGVFFLDQSGSKMASAAPTDGVPANRSRDPLSQDCWKK